MKKILILGGGISGLAAAWRLKQKEPDAEIVLLEKTNRLGGWIRSEREEGFFFEKGPRTFQAGRCPRLLQLIREAGLEGELIFSDPKAAKRYLWMNGRLRSLGSFLPRLVFPLLKEAFVKRGGEEDESIYEFAARRFNPNIADTLFDPLTLGIYAGDIRKLSIRSCFTRLFEMEQGYGSLIRAMMKRKTKKTGSPETGGTILRDAGQDQKKARGLFTLKGGVGRLVEEMEKKLEIEVVFDCPIERLIEGGVEAGGRVWMADKVYSALPNVEMGRLAGTSFQNESIWVVNLGFATDVLGKKGFGYLVPTKEGEALLGMIWDSAVFPRQGQGTRLTAMVRNGGDGKWAKEKAREALKRHLGIETEPEFISEFFAKDAIPQFEVGYWKRIAQFENEMKKKFPRLILLGNYFEGVSVEACLERVLSCV